MISVCIHCLMLHAKMRRFTNTDLLFCPWIFTKIFFPALKGLLQHIEVMGTFICIFFQHIELHRHLIAIYSRIITAYYFELAHIKKNAVIIDGIICFPVVSYLIIFL